MEPVILIIICYVIFSIVRLCWLIGARSRLSVAEKELQDTKQELARLKKMLIAPLAEIERLSEERKIQNCADTDSAEVSKQDEVLTPPSPDMLSALDSDKDKYIWDQSIERFVLRDAGSDIAAETFENVQAVASEIPSGNISEKIHATVSHTVFAQKQTDYVQEESGSASHYKASAPSDESEDHEEWDVAGTLRRWNVLPPEDHVRGEVAFMQWWAPRIGGFLAVLALVFFGVWISQGTPPWVKLLEMIGVSLAFAFGGGYLLERKPKLGEPLLATGLVMFYVDAMAACMLPAVQIIHHGLLGLIIQLLALIPTLIVGWRRKSENYLLMVQICTFVSGLFAVHDRFGYAALISALLSYILGFVAFPSVMKRSLIVVGCIGVYLPLWGLGLKAPYVADVDVIVCFVFFAVTVSVLPLLYFIRQRSFFEEDKWEHFFQIWNTGNALAGMYFLCVNLPSGTFASLEFFYGFSAVLLGVWALLFGMKYFPGFHFQLFFLKANAMLALCIINVVGDDFIWAVLLVQVIGIAWSARRSKSHWIEGLCVVGWLLGGFYWYQELSMNYYAFLSAPWLCMALFPFVSLGVVSWVLGDNRWTEIRYGFCVFFVFIGLWQMFSLCKDSSFHQFILIACIFIPLVWAVIPGFARLLPLLFSGIFFVLSHVNFWFFEDHIIYFVAELLISCIGFFAVKRYIKDCNEKIRYGIDTSFVILMLLTTMMWLLKTPLLGLLREYMVLWMLLVVLTMNLCARRISLASGDLSFLVYGFIFFAMLSIKMGVLAILLTGLGLFGVMLLPVCFSGFRNAFRELERNDMWTWITVVIHVGLFAQLMVLATTWVIPSILFLGISVLFAVIWVWKRWNAFYVGALSILAYLFARHIWVMENVSAGEFMLTAFSEMAVAWIFGLVFRKNIRSFGESPEISHSFAMAIAGFFLVGMVIVLPALNLNDYYTWLFGLLSLVTIMLGLAFKSKPYRIVGLVGLGCAIVRLFIIDINSIVMRIIAFTVLSCILILLGYLYGRLSHHFKE